ncbi:MAG: histidine-type phosphatase, partial [Prevotella sp.]|nr:histidine-type phosphatase [Prevotella sp.]
MSLTVCAQKTREQMGGVYYAYPVNQKISIANAPDGYAPFYISHYGRHGSRWLPSDERYQWVMSQFSDKSNLTSTGKHVRKQMKKVWKNARGHGGLLTPLGARQHQGIAHRMLEAY